MVSGLCVYYQETVVYYEEIFWAALHGFHHSENDLLHLLHLSTLQHRANSQLGSVHFIHLFSSSLQHFGLLPLTQVLLLQTLIRVEPSALPSSTYGVLIFLKLSERVDACFHQPKHTLFIYLCVSVQEGLQRSCSHWGRVNRLISAPIFLASSSLFRRKDALHRKELEYFLERSMPTPYWVET